MLRMDRASPARSLVSGTNRPHNDVDVSDNSPEDLYAAMASMPGVNIAPDSGAGENGLYWYPTTHDPETQQRSYARTGHWDNVRRDNYEMIIESKVNRILFDDDLAATGVQFVSRNGTSEVHARREVILAAGTIHTPQILMLSGVGPEAALADAGLETKVDLPGVGANFQDHSYIPQIAYRCEYLFSLSPCQKMQHLANGRSSEQGATLLRMVAAAAAASLRPPIWLP
jgi:choline dehydrogenase-like flavoprotein